MRKLISILAAACALPLAFTLAAGPAHATAGPPRPGHAPQTTNYYYMQHANTTGLPSGYCVDDPANSTTNGTLLQVWGCHNVPQEGWTPQYGYSAPGFAQLVTENGKCIDDPGDSQVNGTQIQIWNCNGGNAQAWEPVSINAPAGSWPAIWVNANGKCLDLINDNNANGTHLQIWTCRSDNSQAWIGP